MAAIKQRESGRWEARVRRRGGQAVSRTFGTRREAEAWAKAQEAEMDRGTWLDGSIAHRTTLGEVLADYKAAVAVARGCPAELGRLDRFRDELGAYRLGAVSPGVLLAWRDERLKAVSPGTVAREMGLLGGVLSWARKERLIPLPQNPVAAISAPATSDARDRRLTADELDRLLAAMADASAESGGAVRKGRYRVGSRQPWLRPAVEFALETAMRQGEILALTWQNVNISEQTAFLPVTKNGESRTVPLSRRAVEILESIRRPDDARARVFPVTSDALKKAWTRALRRARLTYEAECRNYGCAPDGRLLDLRFHDLRHEATSRLAEKLPNLIELAAVTGHRDLRMLKRYYHPRAAELAKKLG